MQQSIDRHELKHPESGFLTLQQLHILQASQFSCSADGLSLHIFEVCWHCNHCPLNLLAQKPHCLLDQVLEQDGGDLLRADQGLPA